MTQQDAATFFGVSIKTWWQWEKNGPSRLGTAMLRERGWLP